MCGKGSSGGGFGNLAPMQQNTVQASPEAIGWYQQAMGKAQQAAATPWQNYSTDPNAFVAPLTATQQAGIGGIYGAQGAYQPYYGAAAAMTAGAGATSTPQVLGQYMNPYMQQVTQPVQQALQQQQGQQLAQQQAEAIRSGAFGGDRAGLQRQALRGQQQLGMGQALSPLYAQAYQSGLGAAQTDLARQLQAGQTLGQLGTGAQTAALQAPQALLGAGTLEQQTQQAGLSALYNQFQQARQYPYQQAQFLANIAGGLGPLLGQQTFQSQATNPFGMFLSDPRVKSGIRERADGGEVLGTDGPEPIGQTYDGQDIWRYSKFGQPEFGLMAPQVAQRYPEAVGEYAGYQTIDPAAATDNAALMGKGLGGIARMGGAVSGPGDYARGGYADGGIGDLDDLVAAHKGIYGETEKAPESVVPTGQVQAAKGLEPAKFEKAAEGKSVIDQARGLAGLAKDVVGVGSSIKGLFGSQPSSETKDSSDSESGGFWSGLGSLALKAAPYAMSMFSDPSLKGGIRGGYATRGGVKPTLQANQLYDYYVDELGAHPNEARVLTSAAGAESNYDPTAVHDQGTGYGLYGHRLERLDAMRKASGEESPSWQNQAKFTLNELRSRPEHALVMKENATPEDLTLAQMHFERPEGYRASNPTAAPSWGSRLARTKGIMGALDEPVSGVTPKDRSMMALDDSSTEGLGAAGGKDDSWLKEETVVPAIAGLGSALEGMVTAPTIGLGGALLKGAGAGLAGGAKTYADLRTQELARQLERTKLGLQERNVNVEEQKANIALQELLRKRDETKKIGELIKGQAGVTPPVAPVEGGAPVGAPPAQKSEALRMSEASAAEANRYRQAAAAATDIETQQKYLNLAQAAEKQSNELRSGSPEVKQQAAAGEMLSEEYKTMQKNAEAAPDTIAMLNKMKTYLDDPSVYTGLGAEQVLDIKRGMSAIPGLRNFVSEKGIADTERFSAAAKKMVTDATGGSLGAGISNADVRFLESRAASLGTSKEGNKQIIDQAIRLEERKREIAEFQRKYIEKHGSLDANYRSELAKWADEHRLFPEEGKTEKTEAPTLPPKDQLKVGEVYTVNGKKGKWTGTGFVEMK